MSLFRIFKNPFVVYIGAFASALLLYQLGLSGIYPPLNWELLLFFALTFAAALVLAVASSPLVSAAGEYNPGILTKYAVIFVIVTFAVECYMMGGVPLFLVMRGAKFYEMEAAAHHLHVFTLWSAFSTIRFVDFLYSSKPVRYRYLAEAALVVVIYTLMIYRGPAIMTLCSWAFLTVIRFNGLRPKYFAGILAATVLVIYVNGSLGEIRSPGQADALVAVPANRVHKSDQPLWPPSKAFWAYLYATVPMANFQNAVDKMDDQKGTFLQFAVTELIPDTFSRRIMPLLYPVVESDKGAFITRDQLYTWKLPLVAEGLNTSTLFGRSYGYLGWSGPVLMFGALSVFSIAYMIVMSYSPYCVPALALLNTLVLFCLINNMLASAAMIPQLAWPLLITPWWRLLRQQRN